MKKILSVFLCLLLALCLSACYYNPPEGWTKNHHTYDEVLAFARTIDPNATVAEEYTDTDDEYGYIYREWNAVINGVNCHVASVPEWVWNEGIGAGEFAKTYYYIDTDYDYTVMKNILDKKYPDWKVREEIGSGYLDNDTIFVSLSLAEYRMLSDAELEQVWQTAYEINEEYEKTAIGCKANFSVPSPGEFYSSSKNENFVSKNSSALIRDFTEQGKKDFLQEYKDDWALMESGLPVYD